MCCATWRIEVYKHLLCTVLLQRSRIFCLRGRTEVDIGPPSPMSTSVKLVPWLYDVDSPMSKRAMMLHSSFTFKVPGSHVSMRQVHSHKTHWYSEHKLQVGCGQTQISWGDHSHDLFKQLVLTTTHACAGHDYFMGGWATCVGFVHQPIGVVIRWLLACHDRISSNWN